MRAVNLVKSVLLASTLKSRPSRAQYLIFQDSFTPALHLSTVANMSSTLAPVIALSHGGGPMPLMVGKSVHI